MQGDLTACIETGDIHSHMKNSAPLTHMHAKPPVCTALAVKGSSKKAAEKFLWYYLNHIL